MSFALQLQTSISPSIISATVFLKDKIKNNQAVLDCMTEGYPSICQFDQTGQSLVSYFVVFAVGDLLNKHEKQKIVARILHDKPANKWIWGYRDNVTPDADDTSFALQTLLMLGAKIDANDLDYFYVPSLHAYRTFVNHTIAQPVSYRTATNNTGVHVDVNTNLFNLLNQLHKKNLINYDLLVQFQLNDGSWRGYFYNDKMYTSYMALRLLCHKSQYKNAADRGITFIEKSQLGDGSWGNPYNTAFALEALLTCRVNNTKSIRNAVNYLIITQQRDGSWKNEARIWTFVNSNAPLLMMHGYDQKRSLTTAIALRALRDYQTIYSG